MASNRTGRARFRSRRIANFTESVIREMTRHALDHGAVNLAQGFPDFPAPRFLKQAAAEALDARLARKDSSGRLRESRRDTGGDEV